MKRFISLSRVQARSRGVQTDSNPALSTTQGGVLIPLIPFFSELQRIGETTETSA